MAVALAFAVSRLWKHTSVEQEEGLVGASRREHRLLTEHSSWGCYWEVYVCRCASMQALGFLF